jgi:hypothetical protein
MYCKKIKKLYRPNILWVLLGRYWVGYYEFHDERHIITLSENPNEDRAVLESMFNKRLAALHLIEVGRRSGKQ